MARFCMNCGARLRDNVKFCESCGEKVPVPGTTPTQSHSRDVSYPPQQAAQITKKTNNEQPPASKKSSVTAGAVICMSFLCTECLPYLMKSIIFIIKRVSLSAVAVSIIDIIGFVIAAVVLMLGGKRLTGRLMPAHALMVAFAFAADRAVSSLIAQADANVQFSLSFIFIIVTIVVKILLAALLVKPLYALFSPVPGKAGGKIVASLSVLSALCIPYIASVAWSMSPFEDAVSVFSVLAFMSLTAFFQTALLTFSVHHTIKKHTPAPPTVKVPIFQGVFGIAFAALFVFALISENVLNTVANTAKNDVYELMTDAELEKYSGDMTAVLMLYNEAGEHVNAWKTIAEGESYTIPDEFAGDSVLEYLSCLKMDADELKHYLTTSLDEDRIDMWCPLMLQKYAEKAEKTGLSDEEKEHVSELTYLCAAKECFVFTYPTLEEIQSEKREIIESLQIGEKYTELVNITELLARIQRGELKSADAINELLDAAEEYPENITIQMIAGYIGAQNKWDNASHYGRTAEALIRYRDLWLKENSDSAGNDDKINLDTSISSMLVGMKQYEQATGLLEEILKAEPENKTVMQQLAYCYNVSNDAEKSYDLNKKLYNIAPDDSNVIWSYCIGALKHGEKEEALKAASKFADIVQSDSGDNEDGIDQMLFNLVLYISLNDDGSWTDYQYRIYDGESTDSQLLAILEKNDFLNNYVQAVYYEKQNRDPEKALPYAQKLLSGHEKSGRVWYLNGMILYDLRRFDEALKHYKRADELEGDDPAILFALANTYDALEDYQTAYIYCERALSHFPNGVDHSDDHYGVSYHARDLLNRLKPYVKEE